MTFCDMPGCNAPAVAYCPPAEWSLCACCRTFATAALGLLTIDMQEAA